MAFARVDYKLTPRFNSDVIFLKCHILSANRKPISMASILLSFAFPHPSQVTSLIFGLFYTVHDSVSLIRINEFSLNELYLFLLSILQSKQEAYLISTT